jgi:2-polyprenyl-6-methoxyphenol hydroxylase-like FAD-dependent oxidoreductase
MKSHKILIAGAGIGGLAAASSLMKAGHKVEIRAGLKNLHRPLSGVSA